MYEVLEKRTYRTWNELLEREKDNARFGDNALASILDEDFTDAFRYEFEQLVTRSGFPEDLKYYWSIACCQGDGCSFVGLVPVTEKLLMNAFSGCIWTAGMTALRYMIADGQAKIVFDISSVGRYSHENTMRISLDHAHVGDTSRLSGIGGSSTKVSEAIELLEESLLSFARSLCREAYQIGRKTMDDINGYDNVWAVCETYGILFDVLGKPMVGLMEELKGVMESDYGTFLTVRQVSAEAAC